MQCSKVRTKMMTKIKVVHHRAWFYKVRLLWQWCVTVLRIHCWSHSIREDGSSYTTAAILLSAPALSDANCSRLKPEQAWMQDCRAEVSSLIQGSDRFPKLGKQQLRVPVQCCCLQPPLGMSHVHPAGALEMSSVSLGSPWLGFHSVEVKWMQKHFLEGGQELGFFPSCKFHISWALARSSSWVCGNWGFHNKPLDCLAQLLSGAAQIWHEM